MAANPIPILLVLFLLKNRGGMQSGNRLIGSLELESFLDNARTMLNTLDKISGFAAAGIQSELPDMKKVMEIVEKIPL